MLGLDGLKDLQLSLLVGLRVLLLALCSTAHASQHALLIGVSGYPTLPATYHLEGPRNDVVYLARLLHERDVQDITLLADGVLGSVGQPTRAAILQALDDLARRVHRGDWVLVYFSGHGSQQPQPARLAPGTYREPDGLDEIFLPYDVARWDPQAGTVVNGLVDDDIGRALQHILNQGASVWAIFDTCHAGDMIKAWRPGTAGGPQQVWRYVPPSVLGVPTLAKQLPSPTRNLSLAFHYAKALPGGVMPGRLVAFYAAQSDEPAPEESLRPGAGKDRMAGVFTWYLAQALETTGRSGRPSFARLMETIAARYRADGRPFPTPSMEGPGQLTVPF